MSYTDSQIQAAKENAALYGYNQQVSDKDAIAFLDWFHANNVEYKSELEAIIAGLSQKVPNGAKQQELFWSKLLGDNQG